MIRPVMKMDVPHMHPGFCAGCRVSKGDRLYFLDLGITYEYEGNVYLCNMCLADVMKATQGEFLSKKEVDELLSIQSEQVGKAAKILTDQEEFKAWLKKAGIDHDELLAAWKGDKIGPNRVSTEDVGKTDGANGASFSFSGNLG